MRPRANLPSRAPSGGRAQQTNMKVPRSPKQARQRGAGVAGWLAGWRWRGCLAGRPVGSVWPKALLPRRLLSSAHPR